MGYGKSSEVGPVHWMAASKPRRLLPLSLVGGHSLTEDILRPQRTAGGQIWVSGMTAGGRQPTQDSRVRGPAGRIDFCVSVSTARTAELAGLFMNYPKSAA